MTNNISNYIGKQVVVWNLFYFFVFDDRFQFIVTFYIIQYFNLIIFFYF